MRRALTLFALAGCDIDGPQGSGIAIGNPPGTTHARIAIAEATGVVFSYLSLPVVGYYVETCGQDARIVDVAPTDVGLRGDPLEIEAGTYCGIGLVPDDTRPTILEGAAGDGTWTFTHPLGRIQLYGDITLRDGEAVVFELAEPGWITPEAFGLGPDEHLDIGADARCSDDTLCARIRYALTDQAGLYADDDGDGEVDTPERDRGTDAAGDARGD